MRRLPHLSDDMVEQFRSVLSQVTIVFSIAVMNIVVVRFWGATARGELAAGSVLATVAASIGGLGMHDVVVWASAREDQRRIEGWMRTSMVTAIFAGAGAMMASMLLLGLDWWLSAAVGILCPVLQANRLQASSLLSAGRLTAFDLARLAPGAFSAILVLVTALAGPPIHPLAVYVLGQSVAVAGIGIFTHAFRWYGRMTTPSVASLRLGALSASGGLVSTSLARVDIVVVALLLNEKQAGIYSLSLAAAEAVLTAATALSYHALRAGSRQIDDRRLLIRALTVTALLDGVGYLGLQFFASPVLGRGFAGVGQTFLLLSPGTLAMAGIRIRWASAIGRGRAVRASVSMYVGLLVQTALDLVLVPKYGIDGAAVACSAGYCAAAAAMFAPLTQRHVAAPPSTAIMDATVAEKPTLMP
jgi:O-antigen/teichoic acid export membrane protein